MFPESVLLVGCWRRCFPSAEKKRLFRGLRDINSHIVLQRHVKSIQFHRPTGLRPFFFKQDQASRRVNMVLCTCLLLRSETSYTSVACHAVPSWYNVIESVNVSHVWDLCSSVFFVLIRPILTCSTATVTSVMFFDKSWFQCATYQTLLSVSRQALPPLGHAPRNSSSSTFTILLHTLHVAENVTNAVQET